MNILALNTSSILADLCLQNDQKQFCIKKDSSAKHSESVMLEIDHILSSHNLFVKDLDALALVIGPGSFTGIRIGVSIAKGFEMVNDHMKLVAITSFELMNSQFLAGHDGKGEYVCLLNALSGKYYVQHFHNALPASEPMLVEGQDSFLGKTIVCLQEENLPFATHNITIDPQTLLNLAVFKVQKNETVNELVPLYLRRSQAEDELEGKQNVSH